jgi:death-on-curing protein
METPVWLETEEVLVIHDLQIAEHGGSPGIRDAGLLDSALARPKNLLAYGSPEISLMALAAAYAFGITANHPFIDGNKRTALVVSFTFLELNGLEVLASQEEVYMVFWLLAQSKLQETDFAAWLTENSSEIRQ